MSKDKKSVTPSEPLLVPALPAPQASIRETVQKIPVKIIDDPKEVELALGGHLFYKEKQILAVKGADTTAIIGQIYFRFARELDNAGKPFQISRDLRGITHIQLPWTKPARITGEEMLSYLNRFFAPAQLVSNSNGQALQLLDSISPQFAGLIMQPRYVSLFFDLFQAID